MADLRQAILALTNAAKGKVDERLIEEVEKAMPASLLAELIAVERRSTDALEAFVAGVEGAPISWETGVCCCGDDIDAHNEGSGHAPVDSGCHHVESMIKDAKAVITAARIPILEKHLGALSPEAPAREDRLREALIRMIEHFERVDAPEADRAVIQYASKAWAGVEDTPRHEAPASAVDDLVDRFAAALKEKLRAAEAKYGHDDAWMRDDWRDDLIEQLWRHVQKGDPRDVAAYCAFAWHHGWSLSLGEPVGPIVFTDGRRHEAPAEGAGEAAIAKLFDAVEMADDYNRLSDRPKRLAKDFLLDSELRDAVSSLRARSSAPQARQDKPTAWAWAEPDGYVDISVREEVARYARSKGYSVFLLAPAAPSADKLRIAVEALTEIATNSASKGWTRDTAAEALDALKAEGGK